MKKLYITADFNDGDYGHVLIEVSEEVFNKFKPLIDAINNFQPYIMRSDFGIDHNNWNSAREDLGEISLYEKYGQFEKDYIDEFSHIFIDPIPVHCCGSEDQPPHTIVSLKDVITDEKYIVEASYSDLTKRYSPETVEYLKERDQLSSYKRSSDGKDIYSIPFSEMTKEEELLDKTKNLWKKYTVDNNDEKEEVKCVDSFRFSVLCTSSKQVEEVLDCKRRNKKICGIFQFTEGYYHWSQVCLQSDLNDLEEGEYGYEYQGGHSNDWLKNQYDNGDLSGYEKALFKKGHGIFITFKVKDGRAYDWVWDDLFKYTPQYEKFKSKDLEKLGIILNCSDFNSLVGSIEKDSFCSLTNSLVSSFQITKTIFNIDPEEEYSNYERLLENAKENISSPDFIQDLGNFIKINGLGYNFLIRKSTINCINIHTVYVNDDNIDNFDKLDIDEPVGDEVLIYLTTQEQPIRIHFIVDEGYENELAELCYSRLMNEIDWNV